MLPLYLRPEQILWHSVINFAVWSGVGFWIHWLPWYCPAALYLVIIVKVFGINSYPVSHRRRWYIKSIIDTVVCSAAMAITYGLARW